MFTFNHLTERGVRRQASQASTNVTHHTSRTSLHQAVYNNQLDIVIAFVKAGAHVNTTDHYYHNSPLCSALSNRNAEMAKFLIASGADTSNTLFLAIQAGDVECVQMVLDRLGDRCRKCRG